MTTLFLSHSSADQDAASNARKRLQELGFAAVFLDVDAEQGLQPGQRWEDALYGALRGADGVVFLISDAAVGSRWCFAELALARSLGRPLFPARTAGSARHELIADRHEVDLRVDDGFPRLAEALRRAGLDPDSAFGWDPTRSPYPGLAAFTADDAAVFFGRRREIGTLLDLLSPTLAVPPDAGSASSGRPAAASPPCCTQACCPGWPGHRIAGSSSGR